MSIPETSAAPTNHVETRHGASDAVGSLEQRRRAASAEAVGVAGAGGHENGEPVVVTRTFGAGAVLVAVGGPLHADAVERLDAQLRELRATATDELVVDLRSTTDHAARLGRVLGQTRIRCLIDDVRVEFVGLPAEVETELHRASRAGTGEF